jgi:hypothetical protein
MKMKLNILVAAAAAVAAVMVAAPADASSMMHHHVTKTTVTTPYKIKYNSTGGSMYDNPCWTEQGLAFHRYVAGTCVYDPDMYKSIIDETQSTQSCVISWTHHGKTKSVTKEGACPEHGMNHNNH